MQPPRPHSSPPHCPSCTCTVSSDSYYSTRTSPLALSSPSTPSNRAYSQTPTHNHAPIPFRSTSSSISPLTNRTSSPLNPHTPNAPPSSPYSPSSCITPLTISHLMSAVYFSTGPFADAVEAVKNDSRLWKYNGVRQSEDLDRRGREWEEMLEGWRERLREEEMGPETEEGESMVGEVDLGCKTDGKDGGSGDKEDGEGNAVEEGQEASEVKEMEVDVQGDRHGTSETRSHGQRPQAQPQPQPHPPTGPRAGRQTHTQPQIQPTWTSLQLLARSSPGSPCPNPSPDTTNQTATQVQPQHSSKGAPAPPPAKPAEQRRTGLDVFEFEARRPEGGW